MRAWFMVSDNGSMFHDSANFVVRCWLASRSVNNRFFKLLNSYNQLQPSDNRLAPLFFQLEGAGFYGK